MAQAGALGESHEARGGAGRSPTALPWTQRFIEALPVSPLWGGLALTAAQLGLGFVYLHLAGGSFRWLPDLVFALLIGAAPAASVIARRATRSCLGDLRSSLDVSDARFEEIEAEVTRWDTAWMRSLGLITLVFVVVVVVREPGVVETYPPGHPIFPWILWMNVASIWLSARTIGHEIGVSRRFSRLGCAHVRVDLLDQRPLMPFARRGVQGALVPILLISIFSLLFVSGSAGEVVPFTQAGVVAIAALSLILPVQGVHLRLAEQKRARLGALAAAIREAEAPVLAARPGEAGAAAAQLHALLALRGQIEGASEWPWDVPTLVRFALYVAIGVGSWLGGALVEHVVDLVLG